MSSPSESPPPPAAASPAAPAAMPIRRQLETNRLVNQQKRRAWESAKEKSIEVCREYIGDFVRCTDNRMFSVVWACRGHNKAMTQCMKTYMETNDATASYDAGKAIKAEYTANQ